MNKKQLIFACVVVGVLLLSGCAKFTTEDGKAKFTFPFDFPHKKADAK